jgi:RNA polymerase sigma factor (sigma-70 family)
MREQADAQLLRDYAEHGDEAAFSGLVSRYTDLVYSAAVRQTESPDLAADIAQSVFVDLARKAGTVAARLSADASLAGWLHRGTRYAALNHLRATRRRSFNERQAMEQLLTNADPAPDWELIRPVLDEALDSLDDTDREALLLRFFQKRDFRAVGQALGVSDDAAQKRVSRALEQLRGLFAKRGVTVGSAALVLLLSSHAVQAAPAGLAAAVSAAAVAGKTLATTSTVFAATKAIGMSVAQKVLVTSTIAALTGIGIYEARQVSQLHGQVHALQAQQAAKDEQILRMERERPIFSASISPDLRDRPGSEANVLNLNAAGGTQPLSAASAGTGGQQFMEQAQKTVERMKEEQRQFMEAPGSNTPGSALGTPGFRGGAVAGNAAISTKTVNGNTVIVYRGQEFPLGKTQGTVTTKASSIQGKDYAAAFEGDRVLWENTPGAAEQLK